MKRLFDPMLLVGFGLLAVAIVVNGAVTYRSIRALHDDSRSITHTHDVRRRRLIRRSRWLRTPKLGVAGYVITQEKPYLEPYAKAMRTSGSNSTWSRN